MNSIINDSNSLIKLSHANKFFVGYVYNDQLLRLTNNLPQVYGRAQLVHHLIDAYGLLRYCKQINISRPCSRTELISFHNESFLNYVLKNSFKSQEELEEHQTHSQSEEDNCFGFDYDCPLITNIYDTISYLAASSIAGARSIIEKKCHYCINWFGGWHHAHRDQVSGFCYTNDIVFAISQFLNAGFKRILYIDFDLHHGDGVEDAFAHTNKVVTLSFHKKEIGFFPGTGGIEPRNLNENHRYSALNVPFKDGLVDSQFVWIFEKIINELLPKIKPYVIVCQCGADGLSGDRMQSFCLTEQSFKQSITLLLSSSLPILFLGGGGYNFANTARLWTIITGLIVGQKNLTTDIPEHDYLLHYGPGYELSISPSGLPNGNLQEDLEEIFNEVQEHIRKLS